MHRLLIASAMEKGEVLPCIPMICFGSKQTPKLLIGRTLAIRKSYKRRTDAFGKELPIHPQVYRILFSLSTVKLFCLRPLQEKMGSLSIGSVWPEHVFWESLFPCRRCGGGRKSNLVSPSSSFPPCHTIKSHGWEEMHCSLPSLSVVLLDGIIRPR